MRIAKNTVVGIDYTLTDPTGKMLDTSEGAEPLVYLHGVGGLIPGLEIALEGKSAGDSLDVTIPPDQAYGVRDESIVRDVPRSMFPADALIKPGVQFQAQSGEATRVVTVVAVSDENVTVDANHALAGVTLRFAVQIRSVRPATPVEVEHRHVHGEGGHQH